MKKLAFLSITLLGAASFAATPAMTFSYGTEMTERHRTTDPVRVDGYVDVPSGFRGDKPRKVPYSFDFLHQKLRRRAVADRQMRI